MASQADFVKTLELTTDLVQQLISDIKDGEVNFSSLRFELKALVENVKHMSDLIADNDSDINDLRIKIALLEKSVADLESWHKAKKDKEHSVETANQAGKWQVTAVLITGFISLVSTIISIILNSIKH